MMSLAVKTLSSSTINSLHLLSRKCIDTTSNKNKRSLPKPMETSVCILVLKKMPLLPGLGQTLIFFFFQPSKKFRNGCKHCLMKNPSNLDRIISQVSIHEFARNLYKQWTELFSVYDHQLVTSHRHITPFNAIYVDTVHNRRIAPEAISPFSLLAVHFCTYFWALSLEYS